MAKKSFWIHSRLKSIPYAIDGLKDMLQNQHNAWIHAAFTALALVMGWWLELDSLRFALLVAIIVLVWMAEAFNTVFEVLADILSPDYSPQVKRAKDIAAAAVLIAAVGAIALGLLILGPPLWHKIFT